MREKIKRWKFIHPFKITITKVIFMSKMLC